MSRHPLILTQLHPTIPPQNPPPTIPQNSTTSIITPLVTSNLPHTPTSSASSTNQSSPQTSIDSPLQMDSPASVQPLQPVPLLLVTRAMNDIHKPNPKYLLTTKHPLPITIKPTCLTQAIKTTEWRVL